MRVDPKAWKALLAACGVLATFRLSPPVEDLVAATQTDQHSGESIQRTMTMAPGDDQSIHNFSPS